jgi:hypothetical protein
MSHNPSSARRPATTTRYGRPIFYDRQIVIRICRRLLDREDLQAICAEPGMPIAPAFLGWVQDHKEAREIYQSSQNVGIDRILSKKLGLPMTHTDGWQWEEEVRANIERGWPADSIARKYIPPDWSKVYPLLGDPPVWSTENMQAYDDLIKSFTQMLEPRDLMELIWVKEATDATWEGRRNAREKNALPERKFRQELQVEVQLQQQRGAAEANVAKAATALDHSRGLEGSHKYYQGLDTAHTRAIKRRDHALRQIERWRDGLGGKARTLSDRFIAEQSLAERYGADQFVADARMGAPAGESSEDDRPVAPPHDAAEAAPLIAQSVETASAAPALASTGDTAGAAPPPAPAGKTVEAASAVEPAQAAPPLASTPDTAHASPLLAPTGHTAESAPSLVGETMEAAGAKSKGTQNELREANRSQPEERAQEPRTEDASWESGCEPQRPAARTGQHQPPQSCYCAAD